MSLQEFYNKYKKNTKLLFIGDEVVISALNTLKCIHDECGIYGKVTALTSEYVEIKTEGFSMSLDCIRKLFPNDDLLCTKLYERSRKFGVTAFPWDYIKKMFADDSIRILGSFRRVDAFADSHGFFDWDGDPRYIFDKREVSESTDIINVTPISEDEDES